MLARSASGCPRIETGRLAGMRSRSPSTGGSPLRQVILPTGDTRRLGGQRQQALAVLQVGVELGQAQRIVTRSRFEVGIVEGGDQA